MSKSSFIQPSAKIFKQSLGIDVSKSSIAACFAQQEMGKSFRILSNRHFVSSHQGLKDLHKWVEQYRLNAVCFQVVMEATGVYYEEWAYFLRSKGYQVSVMLPNKTAAYAKSLDYKSKNDKIDAQKLAQLSLERDLPKWEPPSDTMLLLKRLCRERMELVEQKTGLKNRLHAKQHAFEPPKAALKRADKGIQFLEKQIKEVEKAIEQTISKDPDIEQRMDCVRSILGIGLVTASTLVSEANGFALFKNKAQLVSYAGYDVIEFSSGETVGKQERISKQGNHRIRKALHFAALTAVKADGPLKDLFKRVLDNTKIKMKAYVAVQRKLLVLAYTLYKKKESYQPDYISKTNNQNLNKAK